MNHSLLEKIQCLLYNAQLNKSFWAKTLKYASHLMNRLSSTAIRGKSLFDIWSGGVAQTMNCCGYLDVRHTLVSKIKSWIHEQRSLCVCVSRGICKGTSNGILKTSRLCWASMSFRWDFIVEFYHLSAGGEVEDQGCIAAGECWCYSTISSWFDISWDLTNVNREEIV